MKSQIKPNINKNTLKFITGILFLGLCVFIILTANIIKTKIINKETVTVQNNLHAIGELKSSQISAWINERIGNAEIIHRSQLFSEAIHEYQLNKDINLEKSILDYLINLEKDIHYCSVFITDTSGKIILSSNENNYIENNELSVLNKAELTDSIQLSDIHHADIHHADINDFDGLEMDIVIPINIFEGKNRKTIAFVLMRINIEAAIYPLIQKWPYPSRSAESILVKQDGDDVLYLTNLRFKDSAALNYRVPMSKEQLPAALALKGFSGVFEGKDYRGVDVLAATHKIPETNWSLITKIDATEVYGHLESLTNWFLYISIAFFAVLILTLYFWWESLVSRFKSHEYKLQLDKKALETHFEFLSKFANDIILLTDDDGHIIEANDKAIETYHYSREELLDSLITELEEDGIRVSNEKILKESFNSGIVFEDNHRRKDGRVFPVEVSLRIIKKENRKYRQLIIRDITQRKRREEDLRLSKNVVDSSKDMIAVIDKNYRYLKVNHAYAIGVDKAEEDIIGHTASEVLGQKFFEDIVKPNTEECFKGKTIKKIEEVNFPNNVKLTIDVELRPYYDNDKNIVGMIINAKNITDILQTEQRLLEADVRIQSIDEELRRSETQLKTVIKAASLGFWHLDIEHNKHTVNQIWLDMLGLSKDEIGENQNDFDERLHPDDKAYVLKFFLENMASDDTMSIEYRLRHKDGHYVWVEDRYAVVKREAATGKPLLMSGIIKDITEYKNTQMELQNTYNALQALSACNEVMVRSKDENELAQNICDAIVSMEHYASAWVGFIVDGDKNFIKPIALSGMANTSIIKNQSIKIKGTPFFKVIDLCQYLIADDLDKDKEYLLSDDYNDKFKSFIKLPIIVGKNAIGCITIFTEHRHHFSHNEISLLQEMADDMGYGINSLRVSKENINISKSLSDSLIKTIEAIAITVEKRDPYTSGHMNHVAQLSSRIAREMGLSDKQIQGIELGATIHDIGKIYIPAEILNRPGKLSNAEFEMIKSHSQVGYDIVKGINFTWPVADMILQHHEKLDGSGYPNGLKGDEIIIEAQIIAVADVVEAVSSHRPYRPALGIKASLDIIKQGRGTLYNTEAVDICEKIIKDGFQFEN